MASFSSMRAEQVIKALQKAGWEVKRQKGSHVILTKAGHTATLSVPFHKGRTLKRGTLLALIKKAGLTNETFMNCL